MGHDRYSGGQCCKEPKRGGMNSYRAMKSKKKVLRVFNGIISNNFVEKRRCFFNFFKGGRLKKKIKNSDSDNILKELCQNDVALYMFL